MVYNVYIMGPQGRVPLCGGYATYEEAIAAVRKWAQGYVAYSEAVVVRPMPSGEPLDADGPDEHTA